MNIKQGQTIMRDITGTQGLLALIKYVGESKTKDMIEIGTFIGESTVLFGQNFKSVTAIDPFLEGYDPEDSTSRFDFNEVYQEYLNRTKPYPNINTITLTSDDAFSRVKDMQYDFIYIDGLHQYEQVKIDIENYMQLVKPGGYIAGHDYGAVWPGVKKAVHQVLGEPDMIFEDTSWIKRL